MKSFIQMEFIRNERRGFMLSLRPNLRNIGVGTRLYEDETTNDIYNRYKTYFKVDKKYGWLKIYVIKEQPSPELVSELRAYDTKIAEENREVYEYFDAIAKDIFDSLDEKTKEYIFRYPDSSHHHHGMGMGIRNHYGLWGEQPECIRGMHPDSVSSMITGRVASYIIPDYDYYNPYYRLLYDSFSFNHLRRIYFAFHACYPDKIVEQYENNPDEESAYKYAFDDIKNDVLDKVRFEMLCKDYGISEKNKNDLIAYVDKYNDENWDVIPYDIGLLGSTKLDNKERKRYLQVLKVVLEQHALHAQNLPVYLFNQKDAVLVMVSEFGKALKRFKRFNADDDVIREALTDDGEAIQYVNPELRDNPEYIRLALSNKYNSALKMRCMVKYRDDEELVRIALEADGFNIQYASDRLKDDLETAKFAVTHQKDYYPESTICNLSARLRDNMEIALLDIQEGHACVSSYSRRLRDSDEIAEALLNSEHGWKIYQMSKRIQKKYQEK